MTLHTKTIDVVCPVCGASPNELCVTMGVPVYELHKRRTAEAARQTREANRMGRGG